MDEALAELVTMRDREGANLEADMRSRLAGLQEPVAAIAKFAPEVVANYRTAMLKRLLEAELTNIALDDPSLLREVAIFADRCDISEELTRLESHFKQADEILGSDKPCGRAMDFLCQEMFREINTIGSKANDAEIAKHVIQFKAELETVREQVQNVE